MREAPNRTIQRTFEVLDYIDTVKRPVRLKDITTELAYPASSASDVLKSLVLLGYLNYDRDTLTYTLTPRITTLGSHLDAASWREQPVTEALHQLNARFGGTVGLGMQSDIYAQYISVLPGRRPTPYRLRPGAIRPVTRCGLGWALLSRRSDAEIERLRRRVNAKEQDAGLRISADRLSEWIGAARCKGYAFSRSVFQPGVGIIAMPVPHPLGGRYLAIGVAGSVRYLEREEDVIAAGLTTVIAGLEASTTARAGAVDADR
jgi:IclR family transcriptional regulator, KDG regulon repressor